MVGPKITQPAEIVRAAPVNLRMFDDNGWERARVAEMRAKGWGWSTIAAILGRNEQTLRGLYAPRPHTLAIVASSLIARPDAPEPEAEVEPVKPPKSPGLPTLRLEPNSYGARVLRMMAKGGHWTTGALAANLERDSSTISVTVGTLARAKLIQETGRAGRIAYYEITDRGRKRLIESRQRTAG